MQQITVLIVLLPLAVLTALFNRGAGQIAAEALLLRDTRLRALSADGALSNNYMWLCDFWDSTSTAGPWQCQRRLFRHLIRDKQSLWDPISCNPPSAPVQQRIPIPYRHFKIETICTWHFANRTITLPAMRAYVRH